MMELRLERWVECMEKNGLKVSRAKTEHLQTTEDTDPVRMERYMGVEAIATVMRRGSLEWFGHVKRRGETENIRAVAEMKMGEAP